jgi:hypothetical protein
MNNTKVFELIMALSPDELRGFVEFLSCPLYNNNKIILSIARYLVEHVHELSKAELFSKEKIFTSIYPSEAYNDTKLRKQISLLKDNLEKYLALNSIASDQINIEKGLLRFLRKRKIPRYYSDSYQESFEKIKAEKTESLSRIYNCYSLVNEYSKSFDNKQLGEEYLNVMMERSFYLDQFYYLAKLNYLLNTIELSSDLNKGTDEHKERLSRILQYIDEANLNDGKNLLMMFYYSIAKYMLDKHDTSSRLEELIKFSKEKYKNFEEKEIRALLFLLAKFRYKDAYVEKNKDIYFALCKEVFVIYQFLFEKNLLLNENKLIHPGLFLSVFINAITVRNISWAEAFIEKYINHLHPDTKENIALYAHGILYNSKGEYKKSLQKLNLIHLDSFNMYINTKTLMVMSHYELGNIEEFYALISSFSSYINKNKSRLSSVQKKFIEHFFYVAKKLFEIKIDMKYEDKEDIKKRIFALQSSLDKLGNMGLKVWFEEKIEHCLSSII